MLLIKYLSNWNDQTLQLFKNDAQFILNVFLLLNAPQRKRMKNSHTNPHSFFFEI